MQINHDVPTPFAVQISVTTGCSLSCSFCALQVIRDNGADSNLGIHGKSSPPYEFIDLALVEKFAREAAEQGWNPRWEFAGHGEPTMHPKLVELIEIVREYHPNGYIMLTGNGSGLLKDTVEKIRDLLLAGVNTLALDDYRHTADKAGVTWVDKIRKAVDDDYIGITAKTYEYPRDLEGNPHKRHEGQKLVFIRSIERNEIGTHQLTNQGGNVFQKEYTPKRCAKPFRELTVRSNGNVAICCDDWKDTYRIGNVATSTPNELWYSEAFEAARRKLYAEDRRFGPCNGCNVKTYRNGLLPDKLGRSEMLPTDAESALAISAALRRGKTIAIKAA